MGHSLDLISSNIINSLAPSTWDGYSCAWKEWCDFCVLFDIHVFNPNIEYILGFISSLMARNLSASSITRILSGISFFQKINGFPSLNHHFIVKQSLKGYRRLFPSRDCRRPITISILEKLFFAIPHVCFSSYEVLLFQAAFILAFFGALRISEFAARNKFSQSPLRISDFILSDSYLKFFVHRSKTDQAGRGVWVRLNTFDSPFCPVSVMSRFLAVRPFCLGSLFIHEDLAVLTKFQFNFILKKSLTFLNLDHLKITSHSFRIGAATEAARLGLHDSLIQKLGRWESDRFRLYVRPNLIVNA